MDSEYADISLLECNRGQSTNKETLTNNSIWTNRLGNVVELNIGDTISVESAFINQRGCANPASIEIKDKILNASGSFNYSQDIQPEITNESAGVDNDLNQQETNIIFRNKINKDTEIMLKDSEANIEVSYYNNANGENHIFLPRNYLPALNSVAGIGAHYTQSHTYHDIWTKPDAQLDSEFITPNTFYNKGVVSGIGYYAPEIIDPTTPAKNWDNGIEWWFYNPNDYAVYHTHTFGTKTFNKQTPAGGNFDISGNKCLPIRPKIDNAKYTMFSRDYYWNDYNDSVHTTYKNDNGSGTTDITAQNWWLSTNTADIKQQIQRYIVPLGAAPSLFGYSENKDLITLKLEKGFHSPNSIAETMTQQLQEENKNSPATWNRNNQHGGTFKMSYSLNTKTMKNYDSTNYGDFNYTNFHEYITTKNASSFYHMRASNNIFVKRPDLFKAGRACNNWYGYVGRAGNKNEENNYEYYDPTNPFLFGTPNYIKNEITIQKNAAGNEIGNQTEPIDTSWEWTEFNLKNLSNLFKVQGRYPDLFRYSDSERYYDNKVWEGDNSYGTQFENGEPIPNKTASTIKNSRFLHMNRFNTNTTHFPALGSDDSVKNTRTETIDAAVGVAAFDTPHRSLPIFIYYIPKLCDTYIHEPDIRNDELCYGFASKVKYGDKYFIRIHPERPYSNGIDLAFFDKRAGYTSHNKKWNSFKIAAETTIIGFDYHFNSWGNVCMLGATGILPLSYGSEWEYGVNGSSFRDAMTGTGESSNDIRSSIIGSNNAALEYDAVSNKFGFKYLHMPEKVGQAYNAGQTENVPVPHGDPPLSRTIPLITDANQECYKLNKRIRAFSYCPDLEGVQGEVQGNTQDWNASESNIMTFTFMNNRLEPYTIFDSHMGVYMNLGNTFKISDRNRQPEIWEKGLLGLLGFTYEQFNPKTIDNFNNYQTRIDYRNIDNLSIPTTNCEVLNTDIQNYTMNPYGGIQYNPQISNPLILQTFYTAKSVHAIRTYFPPIVQDTNSISIEGVKLPKVVQRPYLTIRSDILAQSKYIGGLSSGLNLPIISVLNKINADKDFIQLSDSSFNYTITRPTKFSEITTAICNPDGSLADTDDGNAVIYKIIKRGDLSNHDILSQILNENKKNKKK